MRITDILYENAEHWLNVKIHSIETNVGWTNEKNKINMSKHGVSLQDGIPVISSVKTLRSDQFINNEHREYLIGPGHTGLLVVIVAYIDTGEDVDAIRIISVRKPEKSEVMQYMNNTSNKISEELEYSDDTILLKEGAILSSWWDRFKSRHEQRKLDKIKNNQSKTDPA